MVRGRGEVNKVKENETGVVFGVVAPLDEKLKQLSLSKLKLFLQIINTIKLTIKINLHNNVFN